SNMLGLGEFDSILDLMDRYPNSRKPQSMITIPRANIVRNESSYTIEMAAPGFSRDEFELNVENSTLTIYVNTEDTSEYKGKITSHEYSFGSFTRSWTLPDDANSDAITARYEAGILYVEVPVEGVKEIKRMIVVE
ncbi:MAG TPA: Hsp20/alpha crystallin family protein, partial [Gemmatimonadetes bacterium]|nr:Hsp20/alpha crystallin family protein [Gemmatimonadota bacterium]